MASIESGDLKARRIGSATCIARSALETFLHGSDGMTAPSCRCQPDPVPVTAHEANRLASATEAHPFLPPAP